MSFGRLLDALVGIICSGLGVAFVFLLIVAVILIIGEVQNRR